MINSHQERYSTDSGHEFTLRKYNNTENPLEDTASRIKVLFTSKSLEKFSTITHIRNIENGSDEEMNSKFIHKFGNVAMTEKIVSVLKPDGSVVIKLAKNVESGETPTTVGWVVLPLACECDKSSLDIASIEAEATEWLYWFSCWMNGNCWEFQIVTPFAVVPNINDSGFMYGTEEEVSDSVNSMIEEKVGSESYEQAVTELLLQLAHKAHIQEKFYMADKLRIVAHDIECYTSAEDDPETVKPLEEPVQEVQQEQQPSEQPDDEPNAV